jgi:acetyl esterase/lipase
MSKNIIRKAITVQVLILALTLSSCSHNMMNFVKNEPASYIDAQSDITYKSVEGKNINLDIYTLKNDTAKCRPVIIYIHGGSWTGGDKTGIHYNYSQKLTDAFIKENYAVVAVNYRLGDGKKINFQDELTDCRDAIKWIRENATRYHFDTHRIGLWGESAGAHLSLVCGYLPTDSTEVNFILDNYGPTNLNKLFRKSLSPLGEFGAKQILPKLYKERTLMLNIFPRDFCDVYSPVNMVTRHATPTLIQHGDKDKLVPISQAYELEKLLSRYKVPHKMFIFTGANHSFTTFSSQQVDDVIQQSLDFAHEYFK